MTLRENLSQRPPLAIYKLRYLQLQDLIQLLSLPEPESKIKLTVKSYLRCLPLKKKWNTMDEFYFKSKMSLACQGVQNGVCYEA